MVKKTKDNPEKPSLADIIKDFKVYTPQIVPTQIHILDAILCGGLELGSIIQIVGESGVGKSTLAMDIAKQLCNQDYKVLYLDSEGSISKELITKIGLDENFIYARANTFKEVETILDKIINTNEIQFIFIDSLATIIHEGFTVIDGNKKSISLTTDNTSYNSKKLVNFMNKYNALAKSRNICFIMINQHRNQLDMKNGSILKIYGAKNVIYNSDVVLRVKYAKSTDAFKKLTSSAKRGVALQLEIVKSNKKEPSEFPFYLLYGKGVSSIINDVYALIQIGYIKEEGNGYYSCTKFKAHGINELYFFYQKFLLEDLEIQNKLIDYYNSL